MDAMARDAAPPVGPVGGPPEAQAPPGEEAFVARLAAALAAVLDPNERGTLDRGARHLALAPGARRARPRFLLLCGRVAGAPVDALLDAALAVELIHTASLLHDDILDGGETRRGRPTVNALHGAGAALLAGDLLLPRALGLLLRRGPGLAAAALPAIESMTRATWRELGARGNPDLTPAAWRAIAEGKTGALFGLAGRLAGLAAGRADIADPLAACGVAMGVAFQLRDDLRDFAADAGKDALADLREGNPSYPLILACGRDPRLRHRLAAAWSRLPLPAERCAELARAVRATGALDEAAWDLRRAAEAAAAHLAPLAHLDATRALLARVARILRAPHLGGHP